MKLIATLLIITCALTSCYHVYYAPNTANAPLLSEKKETRVNALYCSGNDSQFEGGELQFATAISKNVGVMVNGMAVGKSESISDYYGSNSHMESGSGSYIEFAAGIFKSFDQKKKWMAELYGGAGFGSANNTYVGNMQSKVNTTKLFLQPAIGYKSRYFEFALVPKVSLINWHIKQDDLKALTQNQAGYSDESDLDKIRQKSGFIIFEPALILRGGGESFKIQAGLSFSNFRKYNYSLDGLSETLNANIGISINIHPLKSK